MRRASKSRTKKSVGNSDSEGEVEYSAQIDNDETEITNEGDASSSSGRKRNVRGQAKTFNEGQSDNEEEGASENETSPSKRKKRTLNETSENGKAESDEETEKSAIKKKKTKQNKNDESDEETKVEQNGKSSKGKKKSKASPKKEEKHDDEEEEEEYEVEKIVDQRTIKGRRQFLVRWKGYTEESDTWENEKDLNCDRLIEEFLTEQEENESVDEEKKEKNEKKTKSKKQNKNSKSQKINKKSELKDDKSDDDDQDTENSTSSKEYEVAKIIEVHFKKDKKREFLIRWKGFSAKEDTWEPEEHLNCPELIDKFMEKVEKKKESDSRELRVNRAHTKRYTLTMHADKRQSRRNAAKQRVTYYECDN